MITQLNIKIIQAAAFCFLLIFTFAQCSPYVLTNGNTNSAAKDKDMLNLLILGYILIPNGKNALVSVDRNQEEVFLFGGNSTRSKPIPTVFRFKEKLTNDKDMLSARENHTGLILSDGRVLITGGFNGKEVLSATEFFDPNTNTITAGPAMTFARSHHAATKLADGRVLISGGWGKNGQWLSQAEIYNPNTNRFDYVGEMKVGRGRHKANLLANGEVVITGGDGNSGTSLNSVEVFDPNTNVFSLVANMGETRSFHTANTLSGNRLLVSGGFYRDTTTITYRKTLEVYDRTGNNFTTIGSFDDPRHSHRDVTVGADFIFFCGGATSIDKFINDCYRYQISTNSLQKLGSMLESRAYFTMNYITKGILVCGGNNQGGLLDTCELMDPSSGNSRFLEEKLY